MMKIILQSIFLMGPFSYCMAATGLGISGRICSFSPSSAYLGKNLERAGVSLTAFEAPKTNAGHKTQSGDWRLVMGGTEKDPQTGGKGSNGGPVAGPTPDHLQHLPALWPKSDKE